MSAILFDLDGVLYQGGSALPGAKEAIAFVRDRDIPHLFVTNTTSRPRTAVVEKLAGMGIEVGADSLFTPPLAARQWLIEKQSSPVALFVPDATWNEFRDLLVIPDEQDGPVSAVVIGDLGEAWDYARLNRALRLLVANPDCELIALGMTRYWQAEDGLRLDTGAFVTALQYASGHSPVVMGKPSAGFFHAALEQLQVSPEDAWMIGDDIQSDIGGAQAAGIRGVLVRTGKFRSTDLDGDVAPDAVLDSVADLPDWWERKRGQQV